MCSRHYIAKGEKIQEAVREAGSVIAIIIKSTLRRLGLKPLLGSECHDKCPL